MSRARLTPWLLLLSLPLFGGLVTGVTGAQEAAEPPAISLQVSPQEATVGERLAVTLELLVADDTRFESPSLGPEIGPFSVVAGSWLGPEEAEVGARWIWNGELVAFRTGDLELPPIRLTLRSDEGDQIVATEPVPIVIASVLDDEDPELADLKPPASVPPDFGALQASLWLLALLFVVALVAWWLHRRYAARLAAAAVPEDPFHRTPPHVWVYGELQRLLEQRLPESGQIERFYRELSRILKGYLAGRYRVDLLEQTSHEVPESLHQAGAPESAIEETVRVLARCDQVKFAKVSPGPDDWKNIVEEVYRIVDRTRPADEPRQAQDGSARPAAEAV